MNRQDFLQALKNTTHELYVVSETDARFECLFWISSAPFSLAQAQKLWGEVRESSTSVKDFLTKKQKGERFEKLHTLLDTHLENLKLYVSGKSYEQTIWIVGEYATNEYIVLRTLIVET